MLKKHEKSSFFESRLFWNSLRRAHARRSRKECIFLGPFWNLVLGTHFRGPFFLTHFFLDPFLLDPFLGTHFWGPIFGGPILFGAIRDSTRSISSNLPEFVCEWFQLGSTSVTLALLERRGSHLICQRPPGIKQVLDACTSVKHQELVILSSIWYPC